MREEEGTWELVIASAGLSGAVREVVVIRPDDEVGVELRRNLRAVISDYLLIGFIRATETLRKN
jgi:hypothetical protein